MQKRLPKWGMGFMVVSSMMVAVYSLRFAGAPFGHWGLIDQGIRDVITHVPVRALTHMLVAPLALLLGGLQFLRGLRARHPKVHRYVGRIYVASCVIAGIGALATAPQTLALSPTCLRILKASFVEEFSDLLGQGDQLRRYLTGPEFWAEEQQEGARAFLDKRPANFARFRRRRA